MNDENDDDFNNVDFEANSQDMELQA